MKAVNREYFFIDYRRAIDSAKYKIHMLDERIKENTKPTQEKKEFACPQCKSQWTTMEVLDKIDMYGRASGFLCRTCDHPLESLSNGPLEPENDDTPAKFNRQFGPLLKLMQQIDEVTIPLTEGHAALENRLELPRDERLNPSAPAHALPAMTARPTAVKGIRADAEKVEVTIASSSEYSEAARAAEAQRQAKIAQQNTLPEWHTKSTVAEKGFYSGAQNSNQATNGTDASQVKAEEVEETKGQDHSLDDVFAALEAQRRKEEEQEEDDDDEDSDDEFEDVGIAESQPAATELPGTKRIKLEPSAAASPASGATPAQGTPLAAGDDEESEEDEFEDVA